MFTRGYHTSTSRIRHWSIGVCHAIMTRIGSQGVLKISPWHGMTGDFWGPRLCTQWSRSWFLAKNDPPKKVMGHEIIIIQTSINFQKNFSMDWIVGENLQENPIFNGEIYGFYFRSSGFLWRSGGISSSVCWNIFPWPSWGIKCRCPEIP